MKNSHDIFTSDHLFVVVAWLAGVLTTITDLYWLIQDMLYDTRYYHIHVAVGLSLALAMMLVSYIWFNKAIKLFRNEISDLELKSRQATRDYTPQHCDVSTTIDRTKKKLKKPYKYIEVTD